jgi:hypothetical protein
MVPDSVAGRKKDAKKPPGATRRILGAHFSAGEINFGSVCHHVR